MKDNWQAATRSRRGPTAAYFLSSATGQQPIDDSMTLLHEINIDDKEDPLRLVPSFEFSQDPVPNENRQKEFHFTPQLPHLRGSAHHRIRNPSQQDAEPILISHSCLLIPMFLAAWWYYTKQCIRKVSGLLRNCPEPHDVAKENFHEKFFRFNDANVQW